MASGSITERSNAKLAFPWSFKYRRQTELRNQTKQAIKPHIETIMYAL